MVELWRNLDHTDVYRNYVGGLTQAFLYERSLYSTAPWRLLLQQHFLGAHKRLIDIGATDVDSAAYIRYDESVTGADWIEALMAATAEPVLFPYQVFEGRSLFSGSVALSLDISRAIQRCQTLVQSDEDIVVDTILTAKKELGAWTGREKSIEALLRASKML
jgi:predicted patatin/cPLA2 family phospholipase